MPHLHCCMYKRFDLKLAMRLNSQVGLVGNDIQGLLSIWQECRPVRSEIQCDLFAEQDLEDACDDASTIMPAMVMHAVGQEQQNF